MPLGWNKKAAGNKHSPEAAAYAISYQTANPLDWEESHVTISAHPRSIHTAPASKLGQLAAMGQFGAPESPRAAAEPPKAEAYRQEAHRQQVRASSAERALVDSHRAGEVLAAQVKKLQAQLGAAKGAAGAREAASSAAHLASVCNSDHCNAGLWQAEIRRLKAKMDKRAVELLMQQQRMQSSEGHVCELQARLAVAEQRMREQGAQLEASTHKLQAAEAQLAAVRKDLGSVSKQRNEAVSKMFEQGKQLQAAERTTARWERAADTARGKHYEVVRRVMVVVIKAAVGIEMLNKALNTGPNLTNTPLGNAIACNVEVLSALIALKSDVLQDKGAGSQGAAVAASKPSAPAAAPSKPLALATAFSLDSNSANTPGSPRLETAPSGDASGAAPNSPRSPLGRPQGTRRAPASPRAAPASPRASPISPRGGPVSPRADWR